MTSAPHPFIKWYGAASFLIKSESRQYFPEVTNMIAMEARMLSSDITELRTHLEDRGLNEYEILPFFMDMLQYMTQKHRSKTELNAEMESLGWGIGVIDETIYSSINALIDAPV